MLQDTKIFRVISLNSTYPHCFHKVQYKTVDPGLLLRTATLNPATRTRNVLEVVRKLYQSVHSSTEVITAKHK